MPRTSRQATEPEGPADPFASASFLTSDAFIAPETHRAPKEVPATVIKFVDALVLKGRGVVDVSTWDTPTRQRFDRAVRAYGRDRFGGRRVLTTAGKTAEGAPAIEYRLGNAPADATEE